MAWTEYHGRHRIRVQPEGRSCLKVMVEKRGSQYKDHFASVCQDSDGKWRYSGPASHGRAIYGDFSTAKGAIKAAVRTNRLWIGTWTSMGRARTRRRR